MYDSGFNREHISVEGLNDAGSTLRRKRSLISKGFAEIFRFNAIGSMSNRYLKRSRDHPSGTQSPEPITSLSSVPSSPTGSSPVSRWSSKLSGRGDNSTPQTSMGSCSSVVTPESPKHLVRRRKPLIGSNSEVGVLQTIHENLFHGIQPSVRTVETAAAAKIFLELHFDELLNRPSPRSVRQQHIELQLHYSPHLSPDQKNIIRSSFRTSETWHLREGRVLRWRSYQAGRGLVQFAEAGKYDTVSILGRGSFGVVKLVREKVATWPCSSNRVFAMKVIRKSEMLQSSQEGHLRAKRDFLVASEGSDW